MTATRPPCHGLIAAWRLAPGEPARPVAAAAVEAAPDAPGLWLHFDLVDVRARAFLHELAALPPAARAALLDREEAIRVEAAEGALFGCLPDIHYDATNPLAPPVGTLHFALLPDCLVTARRHPLRGVHAALQAPAAGSPTAALAAVMDAALQEFGRAIAAQDRRLVAIEDALLRPAAAPRRDDLAAARREALRLARHLDPLAEAMEALDEEAPSWLVAEGGVLAREARRVAGAVRALAALRERGRIAQDQAAALAGEETNRRLLVLSVISAAMLPASLVAGIFGMNVGGVPGVPAEGAEAGWGFAMAMALIVASVGGVLAALRLARML